MLRKLQKRDARLPAAIAGAVILLAVGAVVVSNRVADHLFRTETIATARSWAADLEARVPELPALLERQPPSAETHALLEMARRVGGVFRFKLFDRAGNLVLVSDDLSDPNLPASVTAERGRSETAARILAGQAHVETKRGVPPMRPSYYSEAYVPLVRDGAVIGIVEVYVDQTAKAAMYREAFLLIHAASVVLAIVGGLLPTTVLRRKIRERREAEAKVRYLAHHDTLTGLPNRRQFNERLDAALAYVKRHGGYVGVLLIDLDRFKEVNDTLGHEAGDALLCAVAKRLSNEVREEDTIARLGGDEFAIIQVGGRQPSDAGRLADRLVEVVAAPYNLAGHTVVCGTSVGIAVAPSDGVDGEMLLRNADMALYRSKAAGRGVAHFFESGMDTALRQRRALEQDLRAAVAQGNLELAYQPLFRMPDRSLVGFEALLRWTHPERGAVPPQDFIPLAEETGLIIPIGEWVLRTACQEAAAWPGRHKVSVNLSPLQFRRGDIVATVRDALTAASLPPGHLELEITEGLLLDDADLVLGKLEQLRAMGCQIAMDDFGTGYSSLGYLWRFPFDRLKIDRSFIHEMQHDEKAAAIVDTILSLGRTLNLEVTAEGVETEPQAQALAASGCQEAQGFLLGRPMPAHTIPDLAGSGGKCCTNQLKRIDG